MKEPDTDNRNLKEEILEVTRRMFLQYGYNGTTFQKIADELHIAKSSITYHFKNKFMIMEIFIDDLFLQIKKFIDSFPEEQQNLYWRRCVIYTYAYEKIMSTPRNMELFYHKDQQKRWQDHKLSIVAGIYEDIEKDFHKSYDISDLQMKARIDMSARSKLFQTYQENPSIMTLREFCYYHIYLIGILCKLDEQTIQENIQSAFDFVDRHPLKISSSIFE